jgi:UvrD-like helicase C-terminal domain/AAA domain
MIPTDEQEDALGLFLAGVNLTIQAGAGTGKTSTLQLMAEHTRRRGQYVVFNRAAVNDAVRRMPIGVACSTINSVAARATDRGLMGRLEGKRVPSWQTAKLLGLDKALLLTVNDRSRVLSPSWLAGHVMRALRSFAYSADPEPLPLHFPLVASIDVDPAYPNNAELAARLLPKLETAWADVQRPTGKLRYSHDFYVKQWALGDPQLPTDYLMVDEAQDLSPVQIGVFAGQRSAQVIWVGDSCQQIYQWRGAVDALANIEADAETYLTRSFRFGPRIAAAANLVLDQLPTELRLTGSPDLASTVRRLTSPPRAVLCRTNAVSVERVLGYQRDDVAVHLVGGGEEVLWFARAAERLQEGLPTDHPELGCFDSWRAVQEYVDGDPLGGELKLLVNLVDRFGTETIIEALDDMIAEEAAQVVVSTAHKAKGREWDTVQLAVDFPDYADCEDEDWRLLYVAITRARQTVDPYLTEPYRMLEQQQGASDG